MFQQRSVQPNQRHHMGRIQLDLRKNWTLYMLVLPVIAYYVIFCYRPMYGVLIAFKNYKPRLGILGSPWTDEHGFAHFLSFFRSMYFGRTFRNTLLISLYSLIFGFPAPILLALLFNELTSRRFKRAVQSITYFPHFISTVVICGLLTQFCLSNGIFNDVRALLGLRRTSLLQQARYFRTLYIASDLWQGVGWGSIIYLAAIAGVDPQLYEAAAIDGAGRFARALHVTLPCVSNTIVLLLIMSIGGLLSVGSEKVILLYNPSIYETADVISSYVFRRGLLEGDYSYSAAIGLMNSLVSLLLVLTANAISRKVSETSLF